MGRFLVLDVANSLATLAGEDFFAADKTIPSVGILHIAVSARSAATLQILLDGSNVENFAPTLTLNTVEYLKIPVTAGDQLNFRTIGNETLDIWRVILEY
jgi:hypothetical protein